MFRKAKRWGIVTDELDLDHLSTLADSGLFQKIKYENHCLHHLLPKVREVCPIAYVADQPDMSHLEQIIVNC